jgi:hypothetical protein
MMDSKSQQALDNLVSIHQLHKEPPDQESSMH